MLPTASFRLSRCCTFSVVRHRCRRPAFPRCPASAWHGASRARSSAPARPPAPAPDGAPARRPGRTPEHMAAIGHVLERSVGMPSSRAAVSRRPWVSTMPASTSTPCAAWARRDQHGIGLAHAGRCAEIDAQLAAHSLARGVVQRFQERVRIGTLVSGIGHGRAASRRTGLAILYPGAWPSAPGRQLVQRQVELEHVDGGIAQQADPGLSVFAAISASTSARGRLRARATRAAW